MTHIYDTWSKDALREEYKTMTQKELAQKYGCSVSTVGRGLKSFGIKKEKGEGGEPGTNHLVIITLYQYETDGENGKTLELDIVASIVLDGDNFKKVEDIRKLMVSFIYQNLKASDYIGLATASSNAEESYGLEHTLTSNKEQDFKFDRFLINKVDYTSKVNSSAPRIHYSKDKDEENKKQGQGRLDGTTEN